MDLMQAAEQRLLRQTGILVPTDLTMMEVMTEQGIVEFRGTPDQLVEQMRSAGIKAQAVPYSSLEWARRLKIR